MKKIMIERGKVIRVPRDVEFKGGHSQYVPHIVADAGKTRRVLEDLNWVLSPLGLPLEAQGWMRPRIFPQYDSFTSASNIPELLQGDPEMLQETFGKAKFIIRLKLDSEKFNYYYIDENLPQNFGLTDVIACLDNAERIKEHCRRIKDTLDTGKSMQPLVFEFNDYSLPIIKIALSEAAYIAKNYGAIYYSASYGRDASRLNKVLAKLMATDMEYTDDERIKLVHPVQSIKKLFTFYEENPELEDRLDKALMITSLGIEDDYEYFSLVEGNSSTVVDVIRQQKDISDISASVWSDNLVKATCDTCPFRIGKYNDYVTYFHDCYFFPQKELEQIITDVEEGNIEDLISQIYGNQGKELYDLILSAKGISDDAEMKKRITDTVSSVLKKRFNRECTNARTIKVSQSEKKTAKRFLELREGDGKIMNFYAKDSSRATYSAHVLLLHALYSECSKSTMTVFPFHTDSFEGPCNKELKESVFKRRKIYYSQELAILFGLLYNLYYFRNSSSATNEDWGNNIVDLIICFDEKLGNDDEKLGNGSILRKMNEFGALVDSPDFHIKAKSLITDKIGFISKYLKALGTIKLTSESEMAPSYLDAICDIIENKNETIIRRSEDGSENVYDVKFIYKALQELPGKLSEMENSQGHYQKFVIYEDYEELLKRDNFNSKFDAAYKNINEVLFGAQYSSKLRKALPKIHLEIDNNVDVVFNNLCKLFKALFHSWDK